MLYDRGEEILTTDGCVGHFCGENGENYEVEVDRRYRREYDKLEIDLMNIGIPYQGTVESEESKRNKETFDTENPYYLTKCLFDGC